MSNYWVNQVPELQPLTEAEQHDIIAAAKRGKFSLNELLVRSVTEFTLQNTLDFELGTDLTCTVDS